MNKTLTMLLATVLAVGTMTLAPAMAAPASAATCSGNGCNGQDPQASGCSGNAITLSSARLRTPQGSDVGSIEMRYSRTCATQWIRVNSSITSCSGHGCANLATIRRPAGPDGGAISYEDIGRPGAGQPSQWSRMVYTPNTRSCGTGSADTGVNTAYPNGVPGQEICG